MSAPSLYGAVFLAALHSDVSIYICVCVFSCLHAVLLVFFSAFDFIVMTLLPLDL